MIPNRTNGSKHGGACSIAGCPLSSIINSNRCALHHGQNFSRDELKSLVHKHAKTISRNIPDINIWGLNLAEALETLTVRGLELNGGSLQDSNLSQLMFKDVIADSIRFTEVVYRICAATGITMKQSQIRHSGFVRTSLLNCLIMDSYIEGLSLEHCRVVECFLGNCQIRDLDLKHSQVESLQFEDCNIENLQFYHCNIHDFTAPAVQGQVSFSDCHFRRCNLGAIAKTCFSSDCTFDAVSQSSLG